MPFKDLYNSAAYNHPVSALPYRRCLFRGIEQIRQVASETTDTLNRMFMEVTDMQGSFNTVNTAVEVQASNRTQVLEALGTLQETTEQVRSGSDEIQKASVSIIRSLRT